MRAFDGVGPSVGPQRSPLGLSADPGGFPLYKSGTVVGGVGVLADGFYTHRQGHRRQRRRRRRGDRATRRRSASPRRSTVAATGSPRTARRCASATSTSISCAAIPRRRRRSHARSRSVGALIPVPGYFDGVISAGTAFGQAASGIRAGRRRRLSRHATRSCSSMPRTPCAIRRAPAPTARRRRRGADAERSAHGAAVGARCRESRARADPPAARFAGARDHLGRRYARRDSRHRPHARCAGVRHRRVAAEGAHGGVHVVEHGGDVPRGAAGREVSDARATRPSASRVRSPSAATSRAARVPRRRQRARRRTHRLLRDRANGNLARPFFPDGIDDEGPGPLSKPAGEWSPFSTGLQLDVAINAILQHVLFVAGAGVPDVAPGCAGVALANDLSSVGQTITGVRLGNGLQIFPGSVPIYRGGTLVGAIGVSGDGVDQDDMIAFLGLHNAGQALGGAIGNAPADRRADTADRRRACGCATCSARRRRSSTALTTTSARGSDMKRQRRHDCMALDVWLPAGDVSRAPPPRPATRTTRAAS